MYSPDLIQRIYFEKEAGNDSNYLKVFNELRSYQFDFISSFNFEDRQIHWTCFESSHYKTIIKEEEEYIYFYLSDAERKFEIVIPAHTTRDDLNKPLIDRSPTFHYTWVIGEYFPGLENISKRPVKIMRQYIRGMNNEPIRKLDYWFKKMLIQYGSLKEPILECVDYDKQKQWITLVEKKK